ncbi:MAG: SPOR domain-containing protein [Gammaproteobacteria bacterium]|nr:SPOR domain-containing protein [Gammaproteobacteria bacterium]
MKLTIDERLKHRMVGLAVIISIAAILLPAILKKSTQSFDAMSRVAVRLPQHPAAPTVRVVDEGRLFKTMKVARVHIPSVAPAAVVPATVKVVSLQSLPAVVSAKPMVAMKSKPPVVAVTIPHPVALPKVVETARVAPPPKVNVSRAAHLPEVVRPQVSRVVVRPLRHAALKQQDYAVQIASFSSVQNAKILMNKLQGSGYAVKMAPVFAPGGKMIYKVLVGRASQREEMVRLQKKLYSQMQLRGFVVTANVG